VIGSRDIHLENRLRIQTKALEDASKDPRRIDTGAVTSQSKGLWSLYHLQPDKDTTTGDVDYLRFTIDLCCEDLRARLRDELMKMSVRDLWFAYERTDLRLGTLRGIRYEAYEYKKITSKGL
jgi:hypothetical protein